MFNKVLAWIAGLMGIAALVFRGQAQKARAEKAEQDAEISKASQKASQAATDALVRGVTDEQENYHSDSRPYFDSDRKL